jgi:hypothetical protein
MLAQVFSPWSLGPVALGLWQGGTSWSGACGRSQLTTWQEGKQREIRRDHAHNIPFKDMVPVA